MVENDLVRVEGLPRRLAAVLAALGADGMKDRVTIGRRLCSRQQRPDVQPEPLEPWSSRSPQQVTQLTAITRKEGNDDLSNATLILELSGNKGLVFWDRKRHVCGLATSQRKQETRISVKTGF